MVEIINSQKYQEVIKSGNVLIVLGSTWCKDCVKIEPFLKEFKEMYANKIEIYKIDTRENEELSLELNIRAIPTLIFYHNGSEVGERLVEPQNKDLIQNAIKENFSL
ncbi:thioredoxin [Helicobacter cholecystus]|uniref:Thioredoxin n=1 Tax=Helicobacter cholecystus TaxID=45498 RepID=A0A3D8IVP7_9HELI|nr:thioredoxin family protein [Helicobacter cholecystus]RDU69292.1 thioredoxin [Helicobacter cholecystus]VEJ24370.1 putative thioredoxin, TrxA [Helicobacter cholecystus]